MAQVNITYFKIEDDEAALTLEDSCTQGSSIILKYRRSTFEARSKVYDNYRILCAKVAGQLVGITAWTEKTVHLYNQKIRTVYSYDTRVHPDYRKMGVAHHLMQALWNDVSPFPDCLYMFVAEDNVRCIKPAQRILGFKLLIPLTILVLPIYKRKSSICQYQFANASEIHKNYLTSKVRIELLPEFNEKLLLGYVNSVALENLMDAGCSIWTNENLLAEEVVRIPFSYQIERMITNIFRPIIKLPYIPRPKESIRSWFLFDFYASNLENAKLLLDILNNLAFDANKQFIYIRLNNNDSLLSFFLKSGYRIYKIPYCLLAKGTKLPSPDDKIYLDVRDL